MTVYPLKYALKFDASKNQYINFGQGPDNELNECNDTFSVSIWFRMDDPNNNGNLICPVQDAGFFRVRFSSGKIIIYFAACDDCGIHDTLSSSKLVNDGNWHHVVIVFDDGNAQLYVDGVADSSLSTYKYSAGITGQDFKVGGCYTRENFDGWIGEIRMYNRALSEKEVSYLYNGGHIGDGLFFWLYPRPARIIKNSAGEIIKVIDEFGWEGEVPNGISLEEVITPLPIWIEEWDVDNKKGVVWTKVPKIPANESIVLYLLFGNTNAESVSNGKAVFEFFDDFSSLDGWTNNGVTLDDDDGLPAPSAKVKGGSVAYIDTGINVNKNYVIEFDEKVLPGSCDLANFYLLCDSSGKGQMFRLDARANGNYSGFTNTASWGSWNAPGSQGLSYPKSGQWYHVKVDIVGTTAVGTVDGLGTTSKYNLAKNGSYIGIHGDASCSSGGLFDNIIIRKYAEQEPSIVSMKSADIPIDEWSGVLVVIVKNNSDSDLVDFQVRIPIDADFPWSSTNADGSDIRVAWPGPITDISGEKLPEVAEHMARVHTMIRVGRWWRRMMRI